MCLALASEHGHVQRAFMQAMGLVNDHVPGCDCREVCEAERVALARPTTGG